MVLVDVLSTTSLRVIHNRDVDHGRPGLPAFALLPHHAQHVVQQPGVTWPKMMYPAIQSTPMHIGVGKFHVCAVQASLVEIKAPNVPQHMRVHIFTMISS